jgi:threonylcarbamoyladenosine tRNA methylthiotransferase CDKAL1
LRADGLSCSCTTYAGVTVWGLAMAERQRVLVKSFGCSSNLADAEFMRGSLAKAGFELVEKAADADVLIYNTCAVKSPTENRAIEELKDAAKWKEKKLLVAGCLPLINFERLKSQVRFDGVLGPASGAKIVDAVQSVLLGEKVQWLNLDVRAKPRLDLPKQSSNPVVTIVPVAYGCLGSCSYCCVVYARGRLCSCGIEEISQRVSSDLAAGAKEVWLTGQDMACYGQDIGVNLTDLLKTICALEGEFFIRVGMMTPNCVLDLLDLLVDAFRDPHVFKFLHLPVQSGDNEVLKRMNRFYSIDNFRHIVDTFRKAIPDLTLATDVICGFPGENEEAFKRTLTLIEEVKPDVVNVSKFFPRPRTLAEKMTPKVAASNVKTRSQRLAKLVKRISAEKNAAWMDWAGKILVDERGKQHGSWIGRNFAYKPIVVKSEDESLLGRVLNVRVVKTFQTYLEAEIR